MAKSEQEMKTNERKFGRDLMKAGYTVLPSVVIECQQALELDAIDMNIILHLAMRWWEAENKPHPTKASMAKAIGIHPMTIQRRIRAMEKRGLIKREFRKSSERGNLANKYHLDGLIAKATTLAKHSLKEREKKIRERAAKQRRGGRPNLRVVEPAA